MLSREGVGVEQGEGQGAEGDSRHGRGEQRARRGGGSKKAWGLG